MQWHEDMRLLPNPYILAQNGAYLYMQADSKYKRKQELESRKKKSVHLHPIQLCLHCIKSALQPVANQYCPLYRFSNPFLPIDKVLK